MKFNHNAKAVICLMLTLLLLLGVGCKKDSSEDTPQATYYSVSFNSAGGSTVKSQRVEEGKTATAPTDPVLDGFSFGGWYYLGEEWSFSTQIYENTVLTAKWYDNSIMYRLTTGVKTSVGNRGTAEIVGQSAHTLRTSEGTIVTLRATANEGYTFAGWADVNTGAVVSTQAEYTFRLTSDVTLEAEFAHAITGLDNANNKLLWDALNNTQLNKATFMATLELQAQQYVIMFGYDRTAGVMRLAAYEPTGSADVFGDAEAPTAIYEVWGKKGTPYVFHTYENGSYVPVENLPDELYQMAMVVLGDEQMEEVDKEQMLLSVYSMLKDGVTATADGLDAILSYGEYLLLIRDTYLEYGDMTVNKVLYDELKPLYDDILSQMENQPIEGVDEIISSLKLSEILELLAKSQDTTAAEIKSALLSALESKLTPIYAQGGKEYPADYYTAKVDELLGYTLSELMDSLNDNTPDSSVNDLTADMDMLTYNLLIATRDNFFVKDIFELVIESLGLSGSDWDVTDGSNDFASLKADGKINIENGQITGFEFLLKSSQTNPVGTISLQLFDVFDYTYPIQ